MCVRRGAGLRVLGEAVAVGLRLVRRGGRVGGSGRSPVRGSARGGGRSGQPPSRFGAPSVPVSASSPSGGAPLSLPSGIGSLSDADARRREIWLGKRPMVESVVCSFDGIASGFLSLSVPVAFSPLLRIVCYGLRGSDYAGTDGFAAASNTHVSAGLIALQTDDFSSHSFSQWGSSHRLHGCLAFSSFFRFTELLGSFVICVFVGC